MGTGAEMGSNYPYGCALSAVINAHAGDILSVTAVSSGGSSGNLDGLVSGEYHLGIVQSDVAASTLASSAEYADIRALAGLYPIPVQMANDNKSTRTKYVDASKFINSSTIS